VPSDLRLDAFHDVIQVAMGWRDCHLHQFIENNVFYGIPDDEFGMEIEDEAKFKLFHLLKKEKDTIKYEYDFGDSWEHTVHVEAILPIEKGAQYPICLEGKRACPLEDIGGVTGYDDVLKIFSNPKHPEREQMVEKFGEDFDPEFFDIEDVNLGLHQYAARARMAKLSRLQKICLTNPPSLANFPPAINFSSTRIATCALPAVNNAKARPRRRKCR
jgi:hypothetical protein